jgi:D-lactate dehydrogenase
MKIAVFSTKNYDRDSLTAANSTQGHDLCFFETQLTEHTAQLAKGIPVVCPFVNDVVNAEVLHILAAHGTRLIALRSSWELL